MNRYIIGFLAVIGLALLLIILLFTGGHKTITPSKVKSLPYYANTSAQVKMIVDGPIVAPQNHNSVVITVSQYNATIDLIQGYDGNVISTRSYPNTENSFKNFLYALYYAGFSQSISSPYPSDIGLCSTGERYDLYLILNGNTLEHSWITSCNSYPKTFNGNLDLNVSLFNDQIPDYYSLTNRLSF